MLRGVWWLWNQLAIVNRRIITQTVMNVNVNPGRETDDVCMVNHETEKGSCSKNKLCTVTYIWSRAQRCMTVSKWKFQYPLPWMNNAFIIYLFSLFVDISAIIRRRSFMTKNRKYVLWMEILYQSALLWQPTFSARCRKMDLRFRQLTNSTNDSRFEGSNSGKKSNAWMTLILFAGRAWRS